MLSLGRILAVTGFVMFVLAIPAAMSTGATRRQLFDQELSTLMPFLTLALGGTILGLLGMKIASRALHAAEVPVLSHEDPRLEAIARLGIPVKEGQTFEEIARDVISTPAPPPPVTETDPGARARLEIMIPPQPSDSWLGGQPSLPDGVAWPASIEGPATFIAQIALADLPEGVWNDKGPNEGWLVIFAHAGGNKTFVLHTRERGALRDFPPNYTHLGAELMSIETDVAKVLYGDKSRMISRWPVRILPEAAPVSEADRPDLLDEMGQPVHKQWQSKDEAKFDLTNPDWAPFDWALTRALLMGARQIIERTKHVPDWLREKRAREGIDVDAAIARNTALDQTLVDLMAYLDTLEAEQSFTSDIRDALFQELSGLEFSTRPFLEVMSNDAFFREYERYARHVYAENPGALPKEVRARFEPFWAHLAQIECGFMGGAIRDAFSASGVREDAVLLDIPSSNLVGWEFGDVSRLGAFISTADLEAGRLDKTAATTTHGYG